MGEREIGGVKGVKEEFEPTSGRDGDGGRGQALQKYEREGSKAGRGWGA